MKKNVLAWIAGVGLAAAPLAHAVSDGNYDSARQHCTGNANNSDSGALTELHCHNATLTVRDGAGHEYFGIGTQQTASGTRRPFNDVDVWYDGGDDAGCQIYTFHAADPQNPTGPAPCNFVDGANPPADPSQGLRLYFGADDNLDFGEHDSSESVSNGPSDGGAIVLNLDPGSVTAYMAALMAGDNTHPFAHPVPLVDGGLGGCADGICFSAQTTQRDRTYPDGVGSGQAVANYEGRQWDPENCSGPDDGPGDCGNMTIEEWNELNGDPNVDPGVQIYEDPDAQASPAGPYPLPALYVGTCGVIIGGGPGVPPAPDSQFTNGAGQLVIPTNCRGEGEATISSLQ